MATFNTYMTGEDGVMRSVARRPEDFFEVETTGPNRPKHLPGQADNGPQYGLLTQTVASASVIQQVFPARIRSKDQRDVIFVAENYIELRTLNHSGLLETIARKTDFGSDIRCAKVLWTRKRQIAFDIDLVNIGDPEDVDEKTEFQDMFSNNEALPPQIIVLTLGSGNLMFLYAKDVESEVLWMVSSVKVTQQGSYLQQLGSHLAVDPFSRALAVAAWDGYVRLYSVHSTEQMQFQVENGLELMPLSSDRTFKVDGTICFLEFLTPSTENKDSVVVVVYLVDSRHRSRLLLFEWLKSKPLHTARQHGQDGLRLPGHISIPLLVIPTRAGTSLILVCEYMIHVVRVNDIISGNINFHKFPVPMRPGKSRAYNESLVTAWTRAFRAPSYTTKHDDILLAKENGDIFFLEIMDNGPNSSVLETAGYVGNAECTVGRAFACMDYGLKRDDLVVVAGEMSDGKSMRIKTANYQVELIPMQTLSNWSSVVDFELITLKSPDAFHSMSTKDRVFACTGRGEYGAVTEIRYGKEALVIDTIEYPVIPNKTWLFSNGRLHTVVTSELQSTSYLQIGYSNPPNEAEHTKIDTLVMVEPPKIGLSEDVTLAAGSYNGRIIQVTKSAVLLSRVMGNEEVNDQQFDLYENEQIALAAVRGNVVLLVLRQVEGLHLVMMTVSDHIRYPFLSIIGEPLLLAQAEPSFVEILELDGTTIALVGSDTSSITFAHLDSATGAGIRYLTEYPIEPPEHLENSEQSDFICESAVILSNLETRKLVCGLRNGVVMCWNIGWNENFALDLSNPSYFQIGKLDVRLIQKETLASKTLAHTSNELYELELDKDDIKISQVVFTTDLHGQVLPEPIIEGIAYFDNQLNFEPFTDSVICLTKSGAITAAISRLEGVCKRSMPLRETPRKVLYYEPMNLLVVACWKSSPTDAPTTEVLSSPNRRNRQESPTMSTLKFIDPRNGVCSKDCGKNKPIFTQAKERIYALTNWVADLEGRTYRYILVGTGFINSSGAITTKGRLIVLQISKSQQLPGDDGSSTELEVQVKRKYHFVCDGPVTAAAGFGPRSIIYAAGTNLCMKTLNLSSKKLENPYEQDTILRTEVIDISVNEPYVTVTCIADSLKVFRVDNLGFHPFCNDPEPRSGFSHIPLIDDMFLVSDKDVGVLGLWQPPTRRVRTDMPIVFETEMLSSICKFRTGHVRPLWHLPCNFSTSSPSPPISPSSTLPGVIPYDKDIIGAGVDGAIYTFTLLTLDALHLLKIVQALYYKTDVSKGGGGGRGMSALSTKHITMLYSIRNNQELPPHERNVSGDVLVTVYKRGEEWLRRVVGPHGTDAHSALSEFAGKLLGDYAAADPVPAVRSYLKRLLLKGVTL